MFHALKERAYADKAAIPVPHDIVRLLSAWVGECVHEDWTTTRLTLTLKMQIITLTMEALSTGFLKNIFLVTTVGDVCTPLCDLPKLNNVEARHEVVSGSVEVLVRGVPDDALWFCIGKIA